MKNEIIILHDNPKNNAELYSDKWLEEMISAIQDGGCMSALASKAYKIDWVSIEDNLPDDEDTDHVRVRMNENPRITSAYYASYCDEKKQWIMPRYWESCIVTHWGKIK